MEITNRQERVRCILTAEYSFANGAFRESCVLRDVSETGARLFVQNDVPLPASFELKVPKRPNVRGAVICWRHDNEVGVEFIMMDAPLSDMHTNKAMPQKVVAMESFEALLQENARLKLAVTDLSDTIVTLRKRVEFMSARDASATPQTAV